MAILLDNVGTQHYVNKMVLAENRKVNGKPLPSALAEIDTKLDEMKVLFDEEYGSALDMKLENNENVFSVGTGSGVDKSSEVENSFSDVEVFGNSMVNLTDEKRALRIGGFGNGEFTYQTQTSSHVKAVCAIEGKYNVYDYCYIKQNLMKPNTTYTLIFDDIRGYESSYVTYKNMLIHDNLATIKKVSKGVFTLATKSDLPNVDGASYAIVYERGSRDYVVGDVIESANWRVLEGDYTNKPLPSYFEGIKSVGEKEDGQHKIEVLSVGKNIIHSDIRWTWGNCSWGDGQSFPTTTKGGRFHNIDFIGVKPNTKYTTNFLMKGYTTPSHTLCCVHFYRSDKTYISGLEPNNSHGNGRPYVFTTPSDCEFIRLRGDLPADGDINNTIMLSLGNVLEFPKFESYKQDKKQISLSEPLRGLPNGTRDSIEKINGEWKLVRRCGWWVITATEPSWGKSVDFTPADGWSGFNFSYKSNDIFTDKNRPKDSCVRIGNNMFGNRWAGHLSGNRGMDFHSGGNGKFVIENSIVPVGDLDTLRSWLSENYTEIIYELATPTIEDIDEATLQVWKNGAISIDDPLPVSTTHTVALNKPMQIKRNIEELTQLRKRVEVLESFYDQVSLEQDHKLRLLAQDFELDYNS